MNRDGINYKSGDYVESELSTVLYLYKDYSSNFDDRDSYMVYSFGHKNIVNGWGNKSYSIDKVTHLELIAILYGETT